jgi:hypothetical protein
VLARYVSERTRAKGYSYYVTGTVKIVHSTAEMLVADVRGTDTYTVNIVREDEGLISSCDCPFFLDRKDVCKHIWAVILAADAEGLLPPDGPDAWLDVMSEEDARTVQTVPRPSTPGRFDAWERFLDGVLQQIAVTDSAHPVTRYANGELLYVIDRDLTLQGHGVAVTVLWRQRKKNGEWGKPQPAGLTAGEIAQLPEPIDREILAALIGAADPYAGNYTTIYARASFRLVGPITERALWLLASSHRLFLREANRDYDQLRPVSGDEGPPWVFSLELLDGSDERRHLSGYLARGNERMDVREPQLVLESGYLIARGALARLDHGGAFAWLAELRRLPQAPSFPPEAAPRLIETLARGRVDPAVLPKDLRYEVVQPSPRPRVSVARARTAAYPGEHELLARVEFDYDGTIVPNDERTIDYDPQRLRMVRRDALAERNAVQRLQQLGFRRHYTPSGGPADYSVAISQFGRAVRTLVAEDWHVFENFLKPTFIRLISPSSSFMSGPRNTMRPSISSPSRW